MIKYHYIKEKEILEVKFHGYFRITDMISNLKYLEKEIKYYRNIMICENYLLADVDCSIKELKLYAEQLKLFHLKYQYLITAHVTSSPKLSALLLLLTQYLFIGQYKIKLFCSIDPVFEWLIFQSNKYPQFKPEMEKVLNDTNNENSELFAEVKHENKNLKIKYHG